MVDQKDDPAVTPSPGRIVHVLLEAADATVHVTRPLMVVDAQGVRVSGWVFGKNQTHYVTDVPYARVPKLNHWSWPNRL